VQTFRSARHGRPEGLHYNGFLALALSLAAATAVAAQQNPAAPVRPPVPRLAIRDDRAGAALAVLDRAGSLPFPVAVQVEAAGAEPDAALNRQLDTFADRRIPIWLSVPAPARIEDAEAWRASLGRLLERHGRNLTILEVLIDDQPAAVAAFSVRVASTEVRAAYDTIRVALGGRRMIEVADREAIYTADVAPYVDLLALPEGAIDAARAWLSRADPAAALIVSAGDADRAGGDSVSADNATRRLLDTVLRYAGTGVSVSAWRASDPMAAALQAVVPVAALLTHDIEPLDESAAGLQLSVGIGDVGRTLSHRLLFDNQTFATYLAYWGERGPDGLRVSITLAIEGTPIVYDLLGGSQAAAAEFSRDAATRQVRASVPLTGGPMLVDFNAGAADVFAERSGVRGERQLSVAEVIARHQARQRLQDAVVRNYVARVRMEQHFRPTMTDAGYDVVTENRYFVTGADVEWEELSFSVNGSTWGSDRPPFPLLQPEKVLSLPLLLRFDEGYRYRLDGTARVDGHDCYVVRFEPLKADASLYTGTIWVDRTTFARIRVQAVQGGLAAPVVSNEEIQRYTPPITVGNQELYLFNGLTARQIMLIAGRNLLVEKSVTFTDFKVNDPAFEDAREAARSSDHVMFRETVRGLRYYIKQDGARVVSDRATKSAKAMAMGVYVDPSYAFPLPILGINYLDFEFGSPNSQLALLFAGVLAAGNIQRPKLGSTPLDASVDFFAIAVPSSDRVYDAGGERKGEALLTWPMTTGLNLGWQYTPFQKATLQYQFRFDAYVRDRTTDEAFTVPSSTVTNGIGGAWEYRRGGYSLLFDGARFIRSSWQSWGLPGAQDGSGDLSGRRAYAKYTASLSRDFYFKVFHKVHLNGAWFGGSDLDRFAKYQFGMFDNTKVHGVPASGVRYSELAMARGSYSLDIFGQYRLDLFVEQAWGSDRPLDPSWQPITGFGVAVNVRAPKNTILRIEAGKSRLPPRYRNVGSTTLQVLLLKPLGK
jgi:hypothetical protein